MNEEARKGASWLVPALAGLAVGAVVAGGPLGYYSAQLRAQLSAATTSIAQLQASNGQLEATKKQLQASATQLQAERDSKNAELQAQEARSVELAKPDLPIQLSFRRGVVASGLVLTIKNVSNTDIPVIAQFTGSGARSQALRLVIAANGIKEIGGLEGWAFAPGDSVTLSNPSYRALNRITPNL